MESIVGIKDEPEIRRKKKFISLTILKRNAPLKKEKLNEEKVSEFYQLLPKECRTGEAEAFKGVFEDVIRNLLLKGVPENVIRELVCCAFPRQIFSFEKKKKSSFKYFRSLCYPFFKGYSFKKCKQCNEKLLAKFAIYEYKFWTFKKPSFNEVKWSEKRKIGGYYVCGNCGIFYNYFSSASVS
jgi:hypothetical protein